MIALLVAAKADHEIDGCLRIPAQAEKTLQCGSIYDRHIECREVLHDLRKMLEPLRLTGHRDTPLLCLLFVHSWCTEGAIAESRQGSNLALRRLVFDCQVVGPSSGAGVALGGVFEAVAGFWFPARPALRCLENSSRLGRFSFSAMTVRTLLLAVSEAKRS